MKWSFDETRFDSIFRHAYACTRSTYTCHANEQASRQFGRFFFLLFFPLCVNEIRPKWSASKIETKMQIMKQMNDRRKRKKKRKKKERKKERQIKNYKMKTGSLILFSFKRRWTARRMNIQQININLHSYMQSMCRVRAARIYAGAFIASLLHTSQPMERMRSRVLSLRQPAVTMYFVRHNIPFDFRYLFVFFPHFHRRWFALIFCHFVVIILIFISELWNEYKTIYAARSNIIMGYGRI